MTARDNLHRAFAAELTRRYPGTRWRIVAKAEQDGRTGPTPSGAGPIPDEPSQGPRGPGTAPTQGNQPREVTRIMSNAISTRQVGERLGITPRRVRYLARHRDGFPQPLALDGGRLYFDPAAVDAWAQTADRTPGAPRGSRNNPHGRRGRPEEPSS